jgi:lipopolysaccharide/colanic/teichoic acid biosynthesis glycosyltransferase
MQQQTAEVTAGGAATVTIREITAAPQYRESQSELSPAVSWPQRLAEVSFASAVLLAALPLMTAIWLVIRFTSRGNPLFLQTRMGLGTAPFKFLKFRTMYVDARECFPDLYTYRYTEDELMNLRFKLVDDPRVTPIGRWLRVSTLDELPNFWNVLTGHMAIVGPRPEIPEMLPYYRGEMLEKFSARPGVTGLAQILGRGRLGFLETAALDVEYAQTRCILLDVKIIIQTIWKILKQDGAF